MQRQDLDLINRLLGGDKVPGMGAYSLGVVSSLAELDGVTASRWLLEKALTCATAQDARDLYDRWRATGDGEN